MTVIDTHRRAARCLLPLFLLSLLAAAPSLAQSRKPAKKSAPPAPAQTAPPKVQVSVDTILDRRTTRDFPRSELSITFKLEGEDAGAVQSARARVTKAADDTGKSLLQSEADRMQGSDRWQEASDGKPPAPKVDLASPVRKAKTLSTVEGVVERNRPRRRRKHRPLRRRERKAKKAASSRWARPWAKCSLPAWSASS